MRPEPRWGFTLIRTASITASSAPPEVPLQPAMSPARALPPARAHFPPATAPTAKLTDTTSTPPARFTASCSYPNQFHGCNSVNRVPHVSPLLRDMGTSLLHLLPHQPPRLSIPFPLSPVTLYIRIKPQTPRRCKILD